ncbi:tRNA (guanine(10)-N2)-methyltransferase homolog [Anthonomus grandis grandis]|uniref:tRNA (guanine(10)-N2)-methyltransferase homolog n=1 Tax=Anthonomus grandis grandis TaxID=2921223 RepID=UPI0021651A15|nr:tRNA (guanine(10)-N2)-methyltransferase homolog [Anthonomus grandis grandis]
MAKQWKKYLLWFAQEHIDFRIAEIESLISLFKIEMRYAHKPQLEPYWIVEFSSEGDAKLLTTRSVSLRNCVELWGHETSTAALHTNLREKCEMFAPYFNPNKTFKIEVETFGRHFTQKEKVDKLETFDYLPIKGNVKLTDPDLCLQYIEYYGTRASCPPLLPYEVFFGRCVAYGLRQLMKKLSLKTRKFIGNTSMDPQLSLLMANQAKVKNGDIILDPFVGSGSLLVAAAEFGAYVYGSDIDYLMLHGKTKPSRIRQEKRAKDESIRANMKQYNLEHKYLDVLIHDFATIFWKDCMEFDAIITDPPYGIRESTEKIGTEKDSFTVSEEHLSTHYPAKIEYGIPSIYRDLIIFSAKHLKIGGRLVCWFPLLREDYNEKALPSHPCLKLLANGEQVLSKVTSRRLLTFEKTRHPVKEELNLDNIAIQDFREKYFEIREETRKERRLKEAATRKENWEKYARSKNSVEGR